MLSILMTGLIIIYIIIFGIGIKKMMGKSKNKIGVLMLGISLVILILGLITPFSVWIGIIAGICLEILSVFI